jgi:phosphoribosyl 1,2-cyclic phosphate phosphodiesterase
VLQNLARRFDYIFEKENKYPGAPSVLPIEVVNNQNITIKNQTVIPINAMHGNLQVFGYRIKDVVYLTDVKTIEDSELEKLKNVEVLVINALRFEPHTTHFNIEEAIHFINLVQPKKAYLTHISHILGLHEEVQKQLPDNVFLAYDNLEIEIK